MPKKTIKPNEDTEMGPAALAMLVANRTEAALELLHISSDRYLDAASEMLSFNVTHLYHIKRLIEDTK